MVKEAQPNKYVLEVVKSNDPGHVTYFLNNGTPP